jgi:hypothetical protein
MIVQRTLNTGLCMNIVHDDQIFEAISEDNAPSVMVDVIGDIWLEVIYENAIGVVSLHQKTSQAYEAHIHILPEHRDKSIEAGRKIWAWIAEHLKGVIYSTVPTYCESVIIYLTKFDFKNTGTIPKAWLKNNKSHDLVIMSREVK